jgi:choline-sulfatase
VPPLAGVLLLTVDALRAEMPWTGYPRPIAPHLTELANRGVVYTRAYSLSSYTAMSLGGLLAGDIPGSLSRDDHHFVTWGSDVKMFPEELRAAGIHTFALHAFSYFQGKHRLERGFETWKTLPGFAWEGEADRRVSSPALVDASIEILRDPRLDTQPFFLWVHFMDPHSDYLPNPAGTAWGDAPRDRYDGEVERTDTEIGRLLAFVRSRPWGARVAVVLTADHGEAFGEHGVFGHGRELWEPLVRVPLLVAVPGLAPRIVDEPRSHIDLAPTILELLGRPGKSRRGRSLVPELLGAHPDARDVWIDLPATSTWGARRAFVSGRDKVLAGDGGTLRVFDLAQDPHESRDLVRLDPGRGDPLALRYRAAEREITWKAPTARSRSPQ